MTSSLRTYRPLRILLASVLLFSIAAPLVQYACAMTGASVVTTEATSVSAGCMDSMDESDQGLAEALCPDEAPCSSADRCHDEAPADADTVEPCCCTTDTVEGEKTTQVSESTLAVVLPLVAVLADDDAESSSPRTSSPLEEVASPGTAPDGASLRVLHASFLL